MARNERRGAQLLFKAHEGFALEQHQKGRMFSAIDGADATQLAGDPDALAADFSAQFGLESPVLIEGAIGMEAEETKVDVTGDWRYGAFDNEPTYTNGVRVNFYVPFSGNHEMFQCAASTRSMSMRPVELTGNELIFTYERPGRDLTEIKAEFDKELAHVKEALQLSKYESDHVNG